MVKDEKASKEMINIERNTAGYTNISRLEDVDSNGSKIIITDAKQIRKRMSDFFQKIYTPPSHIASSTDSILQFLASDDDHHLPAKISQLALSDADSSKLEGYITKEELTSQLFDFMKPNSAPGLDWFSVA